MPLFCFFSLLDVGNEVFEMEVNTTKNSFFWTDLDALVYSFKSSSFNNLLFFEGIELFHCIPAIAAVKIDQKFEMKSSLFNDRYF